jgi:hypothetical protein
MDHLVSGDILLNEPRATVNALGVDKTQIVLEENQKNGKKIFGIYWELD